jgi:hypothetical protein
MVFSTYLENYELSFVHSGLLRLQHPKILVASGWLRLYRVPPKPQQYSR